MAATTIVTDEANVLDEELIEQNTRPHVSWGAIFVGAAVAAAATLFLLLLGSGVGLALVNPARPGGVHFLTLGAIYFLAAQAFGLALGGHLTGRLIGPALETSFEEEFRAGAHGLAVWAVAVLATVALVALSGLVAENASVNIRAAYGALGANRADATLPDSSGYWVDTLFRPAPATALPNTHASLDGVQYAQNDTGTQTDASPPPPDNEAPPATESQPTEGSGTQGPRDYRTPTSPETAPRAPVPQQQSAPEAPAPTPRAPVDIQAPSANEPSGITGDITGSTPGPALAHDLQADKAEVGRILNMGMWNGGFLSPEDRGRVAELIAQDANLSYEAATARANDVQSRIHDTELRARDTTRRAAEYASLWTALALLFGAVVATVAAISARWEDDAQAMFVFGWNRQAPVR